MPPRKFMTENDIKPKIIRCVEMGVLKHPDWTRFGSSPIEKEVKADTFQKFCHVAPIAKVTPKERDKFRLNVNDNVVMWKGKKYSAHYGNGWTAQMLLLDAKTKKVIKQKGCTTASEAEEFMRGKCIPRMGDC